MRGIFSELRAIAHASKFTAYMRGVETRLPDGKTVLIKVDKIGQSFRPTGLRFSEFAYIAEVSAGPYRGFGYGEASTKLVAIQKSIAEGVERAVYRSLKDTLYGSTNSNGWAAHTNSARASQAALEELAERDAILVHWLSQTPMMELASPSWPNSLKRWVRSELSLSDNFNQLRVLMSTKGHLPTATTILLNSRGYAVLSHATASSLEHALTKALAETCRIAHMTTNAGVAASSAELTKKAAKAFHPEDHAMFYAFHEKLPTWIFGEPTNWHMAEKNWQASYKKIEKLKQNIKFHQVAVGPLTVGYATSDLMQGLFFGRTEEARQHGLINIRRIEEVRHEGGIYLMPHCVP